jgi:hypothetical protein
MMRLHIDRAALSAGSHEPIIVRSFKDGKPVGEPVHAYAAEILGPARFVFDPVHPLPPAGTYAWIETHARVRCLREPPADVPHAHVCPKCWTRWQHTAADTKDQDAAHRCPKCGASQYRVAARRMDGRALLAAALLTGVALHILIRLARETKGATT